MLRLAAIGSILIATISVGPLASESSSVSFRLTPAGLSAAGGEAASASYTPRPVSPDWTLAEPPSASTANSYRNCPAA